MDRDHGVFSAFKAFLTGAIAGAGLALLFAPSSGDEIRRKICEKGDDARRALKETSDQVVKRSGELIDEGKRSVETFRSEMNKMVSESKKSLGTIREEMNRLVEESRDSVRQTIREEMSILEKELSARKEKSKARPEQTPPPQA